MPGEEHGPKRAFEGDDKGLHRAGEAHEAPQLKRQQPERTHRGHLAHVKLAYALKAGLLSRPEVCERCEKRPLPDKNGCTSIHGHHHRGYEYPLDVQWLCVKCHRAVHVQPLKTHCPHGHPYEGDNLYIGRRGHKDRRCRECARIRDQKRGWRRAGWVRPSQRKVQDATTERT